MYREKLHRQKSSRSAIVRTLMKALEARDFETEGHGIRLQGVIKSFVNALDITDPHLADFHLLAQFHDIGKVGIPDNVLLKPGSLTTEERAAMQQHSLIGYRIANSAPDLTPIADWILKHHEWWNGKGYPFGLVGDVIPLPCRMLAIVDAFDAMTHDRPYRKAMGKKEAIAELLRCSGSQFDPYLIETFVGLLNGPQSAEESCAAISRIFSQVPADARTT
jgi:HD-GYP domain-containing protein (c-di-GMP phosphodiesterase class II)